MPPEGIAGYITMGRGVSIHRDDCASFRRLQATHPERVIAVEWGKQGERAFPIDVNVRAFDRRGLVRDISAVLADSKINIQAMNVATDEREGIAEIEPAHHRARPGGAVARARPDSGTAERDERAAKSVEAT